MDFVFVVVIVVVQIIIIVAVVVVRGRETAVVFEQGTALVGAHCANALGLW